MNTPVIFGLSFEVYIINLIIAVPLFFIIRWIFKRLVKNENLGKLATWISTIILTPIIYSILIVLWITIASYYPKMVFGQRNAI